VANEGLLDNIGAVESGNGGGYWGVEEGFNWPLLLVNKGESLIAMGDGRASDAIFWSQGGGRGRRHHPPLRHHYSYPYLLPNAYSHYYTTTFIPSTHMLGGDMHT
jgi:hypothetical protein